MCSSDLLRSAPESRDPDPVGRIDITAAMLAPLALGGLTWSLTSWSAYGPTPATLVPLAMALAAGIAFVMLERREPHPMVPPKLFANRDFSAINIVTLLVYAALSGSMVFVALFLQVSAGWSPLAAGAATIPLSIEMFFLASRFGALASRIGPRVPMLGGEVFLCMGFVVLALAPNHPQYFARVLPGILLMGLGLSMLVAPLTGAVLAAAPERYAGLASGINNAVSRTGGLLMVAALPLLVGLSGDKYRNADLVGNAYRASLWWCVASVALCLVITAIGLNGRTSQPYQ